MAEGTPVIEICVVALLLLLLSPLLLAVLCCPQLSASRTTGICSEVFHQFVYTDTLDESELTSSAGCDREKLSEHDQNKIT